MINKLIGIGGFLFIIAAWYFTTHDEEVNVICHVEDQTIVCKE